MKLEQVGQIGIVVKNLEAAAKFFTEKLGIGPFTMLDVKNGKAVYRGKEVSYKSRLGLCNFRGLAIELMEPYEGETIQNDPAFLPPGGQGIHHLGFFVKDAKAMAEEWKAQGGEVLQESQPFPGSVTIYLDTLDSIGVLVELIQLGGA